MVESSPAALTVRANNCRCRAAFHGSPACNSNGSRGARSAAARRSSAAKAGVIGSVVCDLTAAFFAARHQDTRWSAPIQQILDGEFHDLTVAGTRLGLDPDQAVKIIVKFGRRLDQLCDYRIGQDHIICSSGAGNGFQATAPRLPIGRNPVVQVSEVVQCRPQNGYDPVDGG